MSQPPVAYVTIDPREQVQWPALLLVVVGAVGILLQLGVILFNVLGTGLGASLGQKGPEEVANMLFSGVVGIVFATVGLLVGIFIVYGGLQMRSLRSYALSVATAVVAMVPCVSPCCCLGLPVGIWALVVLLKPGVRDAFH